MSLLSDPVLCKSFHWFPTDYRMQSTLLGTAFKALSDQNSTYPPLFLLCPYFTLLLPSGIPLSILPVETYPLRPSADKISMKHFLIHFVVINHLFSWSPIGFNLYFHSTPFGPMFVLVNSVTRSFFFFFNLHSARE